MVTSLPSEKQHFFLEVRPIKSFRSFSLFLTLVNSWNQGSEFQRLLHVFLIVNGQNSTFHILMASKNFKKLKITEKPQCCS